LNVASAPITQASSAATKARTSFVRAEVEHHIDHPLAGPVIGVLPAAPALEHRKPVRLDEVAALAETPAV
jgi:hypothetical protein